MQDLKADKAIFTAVNGGEQRAMIAFYEPGKDSVKSIREVGKKVVTTLWSKKVEKLTILFSKAFNAEDAAQFMNQFIIENFEKSQKRQKDGKRSNVNVEDY